MSRAKLEWLMALEMLRFSRRHLRYAKVALALYLIGIKVGRRAYVARLGFVFLQVIDDLLDGDRACAIEPHDEIAGLVSRAELGRFDLARPLDRIGAGLWVELGKGSAGEEGVAKTLDLIRVMMRDRKRVMNGEIWSEQELRGHHRETFENSLDLTLIALESPLRARDATATMDLLGWCSTMRDLKEDLQKGLSNVPKEVAPGAAIEVGWLKNPSVGAWIEREDDRAAELLRLAETQLHELRGRPGRGVFTMFVKSIASFHVRRLNF